jgi:SAM-dependent methyltransferase
MKKDALHFDSNHLSYNNIRPGYPEEIYQTISEYKAFDEDSNILEIGAGNGIASQEIYERWKPTLTLIEPGNNFCELLRKQFNGIDEIKIIHTTFEEFENQIPFDAIFSATAFHWCDPSTKYKKAYELLKDNGLLILYWNYYGIENAEMENEIQKIYIKYGMGINDGKTGYEKQMEIIENRRNEIVSSKLFNIIDHKIIKRIKEFSAEDNTKLLKTFPNHSNLDEGFFSEIEEIIRSNGNKIDARILTNLEIAMKV